MKSTDFFPCFCICCLLHLLFLWIMYMSSKGEKTQLLPCKSIERLPLREVWFFPSAGLFNIYVFNMIFLLDLKLKFYFSYNLPTNLQDIHCLTIRHVFLLHLWKRRRERREQQGNLNDTKFLSIFLSFAMCKFCRGAV